MIKINLLSEGKRAAVRKAKPSALKMEGQDIGQWMLILGLLVGVAVWGLFFWLAKADLKEKEAEVAAAQTQVNQLASVIKEVEEYKAKKAELERKIGVIKDLKANQVGPVRVMDYVSRALPELLWLDSMDMKASDIHIEGRAFNTNAVANFIENLDKVPEFDEPTLVSTEEQSGGVYKFVVDFKYSFAPPKPAEEAGEAGASPEATPAAPG